MPSTWLYFYSIPEKGYESTRRSSPQKGQNTMSSCKLPLFQGWIQRRNFQKGRFETTSCQSWIDIRCFTQQTFWWDYRTSDNAKSANMDVRLSTSFFPLGIIGHHLSLMDCLICISISTKVYRDNLHGSGRSKGHILWRSLYGMFKNTNKSQHIWSTDNRDTHRSISADSAHMRRLG